MLWLVIPHRELGNAVIRDMAVFIVLMGRRKTLISNNTEQPIIRHRPPPPPRIVMLPGRFGALGEAHKRAKLYPVSNLSSRAEAGREAMRLCREDGNTDCKIIYRIKNGCFAAAEGMMKNGMFLLHFGVDTSPSMAETKAMDLCASAAKDCMLAQKAECSIARPPR